MWARTQRKSASMSTLPTRDSLLFFFQKIRKLSRKRVPDNHAQINFPTQRKRKVQVLTHGIRFRVLKIPTKHTRIRPPAWLIPLFFLMLEGLEDATMCDSLILGDPLNHSCFDNKICQS